MTDEELKEALPAKAMEYRKRRPTFTTKDDGVVEVGYEDPLCLFKLFGVGTKDAGDGMVLTALNALGKTGEHYRPFIAALQAELEPRDAVEAMLIIQIGATHVAMTNVSQKMNDQTMWTIRESLERSMTRLSRTYLSQMDSLKKYRAKAQQTVRVERVTVNEGGQGIVGDVSHRGEVGT
jgi:hypothetical protein